MSSDSDQPPRSTANVSDICADFINRFKKDNNANSGFYYDKINGLISRNATVILVDYFDIEYASRENPEYETLLQLIKDDPEEAIRAFELATETTLMEIHPEFATENKGKIKVRIKSIPTEVEIPDIKADNEGDMITVLGIISMVEGASTLITDAVYVCDACGNSFHAMTTEGNQHKPILQCENKQCRSRKIKMDTRASEKVTYQRVNIQQLHEKVEPGRIAADMEVWLIGDDIVNKVNPGERVRVSGFVRLKSKDGKRNSLYDFYLEANSIQSIYEEELAISEQEQKLEAEVKNCIRPESEKDDFDKLVRSIVPSIKGHTMVKTSLLLQAVGSEGVIMQDGTTRLRGDINIMLCGDPGTGKTTLMRGVKPLQRRSVYNVGSGSSKAGLTAAVVREGQGLPRLEAGSYMIADKGIAIIDEIDKTNKEDREGLPTLMDDTQILAIHKYGIHKELRIAAASLHGCNPNPDNGNSGKWNDQKSLEENLPQFAAWLFDRYDVKWVLRDQVDSEQDKQRSDHYGNMLLHAISEKDVEKTAPLMSLGDEYYTMPFMKAYISYVRKNYDPKPTPEVVAKIKDFYIKLRGGVAKDVTMREIGALYRLARASARAHMRNEVTIKDVDIGMDIIMSSMASCGIDPDTGQLNYTRHIGGDDSGNGRKWRVFRECVVELAGDKDESFAEEDLIQAMIKKGFRRATIVDMVNSCLDHSILITPKRDYLRKTDAFNKMKRGR